jgi:hypothetical protein
MRYTSHVKQKINEILESAQGKSRAQKHSIAIAGSALVTGVIFTVWILFFFYSVRNRPAPNFEAIRATARQAEQQTAPTLQNSAPSDTGASSTDPYANVPAIYRPDSSPAVQTAEEASPKQVDTSAVLPKILPDPVDAKPESNTTNSEWSQGSEAETSVVE